MNMTKQKALSRFNVVGSFLRPDELKEARAKHSKGQLTADELRTIEDKWIIDLLKRQEQAGLKKATDGEYRRHFWHHDFFWGLNGVEHNYLDAGTDFSGTEARVDTARIVDKISGEGHPFIDDFKFVLKNVSEGIEPKQTIPAPAQFIQEALRPGNAAYTREIYGTIEELVSDVASAYRTVIKELYEAGARTIQLDDCTWGRLAGGKGYDHEYTDVEVEDLKELYLDVNNRVLENHPEEVTFFTHICRGNFKSTYFASGAYTTVADTVFAREKVDGFFLEYDSERAGGFEPLAEIPAGKEVVLGLVTSKTGELESKEEIIARIQEASQYVPLENLYLSPQCGFSSTEDGNVLTEEAQWNKIQLIREIADKVWQEV